MSVRDFTGYQREEAPYIIFKHPCERTFSGMVSNSLNSRGRFHWMSEGRSSGLVKMLPAGFSDLEVCNFSDILRQFLMMFWVPGQFFHSKKNL